MTKKPRKTFSQLAAETMTEDQRARAKARADEMRAAIPLAELRRARELSQATLAKLLEMDQGNLSKLEQRTDMYVSTLRSYITAMGGELDIVARFHDREYHIEQFGQLGGDIR
ncbi:MAG: XRE family transcriptional regulator [Gemmatimonadaceae bacterium]